MLLLGRVEVVRVSRLSRLNRLRYAKCVDCGDLEGDDKWVSCDMCSSWVHISCAGLDDADFKYLTKAKNAGKSIH